MAIVALSASVAFGLGTPQKNGRHSLRRRSLAQPFGHLHMASRSATGGNDHQQSPAEEEQQKEDITKRYNNEYSRRLLRRRNRKSQENSIVVSKTKNGDNQVVGDPVNLRRHLLLSSAAFLSSALLAPQQQGDRIANAMTESESRVIDIFERTAPAVVFIDTFAERQDALSTNVMEVPIGTGTGFVWDNEGHISTWKQLDENLYNPFMLSADNSGSPLFPLYLLSNDSFLL